MTEKVMTYGILQELLAQGSLRSISMSDVGLSFYAGTEVRFALTGS